MVPDLVFSMQHAESCSSDAGTVLTPTLYAGRKAD